METLSKGLAHVLNEWIREAPTKPNTTEQFWKEWISNTTEYHGWFSETFWKVDCTQKGIYAVWTRLFNDIPEASELEEERKQISGQRNLLPAGFLPWCWQVLHRLLAAGWVSKGLPQS